MATVNVSLDTQTRKLVLVINGLVVAQDGCGIDRYVDHDGNEQVSFYYVTESVDGSGLTERRQFRLPSPEEMAVDAVGELDENGFASKIVHNDDKAKADIIDFLKHNRS